MTHAGSVRSRVLASLTCAILLASVSMAQTTSNSSPPNGTLPAVNNSKPEAAPNSEQSNHQPAVADSTQSEHNLAQEQLKQEEEQRILAIIPNFEVSNIPNAVPLSPGQKLHLALRTSIDPFQFVAAGLDAGISQGEDEFSGYGQGAQGYFKRFGASWTDQFSSELWADALFPILLHEDPRYFRKGHGRFMGRLFYAISAVVITKNDNGTWGPNYANVLGNIAAGGIANIYYPSTDRGAELTFERAFTVTAEGALGAVVAEFWPDIDNRIFHKHTPEGQQPKPH